MCMANFIPGIGVLFIPDHMNKTKKWVGAWRLPILHKYALCKLCFAASRLRLVLRLLYITVAGVYLGIDHLYIIISEKLNFRVIGFK